MSDDPLIYLKPACRLHKFEMDQLIFIRGLIQSQKLLNFFRLGLINRCLFNSAENHFGLRIFILNYIFKAINYPNIFLFNLFYIYLTHE